MKTEARRYASLLVVLICGISIRTAHGDTLYSYTGSQFMTVTGSAPVGIESDFITASFTFANPLPPNLSQANEIPSSWSISDQIDTITSASPSAFIIQSVFSTNSAGNIGPTTIFSMGAIFGNFEIQMEIFNPGGDAVRVSSLSGPGAGLIYQASTSQTGVFTPTPEPATTAAGLLAALGVFFRISQSRRKSRSR